MGGIKYFKKVQIFQKFCSGGPNISKIEINYPGVQTFRYIWTDGTKNGVRFSCDRPNTGMHAQMYSCLLWLGIAITAFVELMNNGNDPPAHPHYNFDEKQTIIK